MVDDFLVLESLGFSMEIDMVRFHFVMTEPHLYAQQSQWVPGSHLQSLGCIVLEFATRKKSWSNLDNKW